MWGAPRSSACIFILLNLTLPSGLRIPIPPFPLSHFLEKSKVLQALGVGVGMVETAARPSLPGAKFEV